MTVFCVVMLRMSSMFQFYLCLKCKFILHYCTMRMVYKL